METDLDKLEKKFKKKLDVSNSRLDDIYEAATDAERERDLLELYVLALRNKVIVPRVGFLSQYDFDTDEYLSITGEGILRFSKLTCKEDLDKAEISMGEEEKFVKLKDEVFFASLDEEEMVDFLEDDMYYVPVVQVMTIPDKEIEIYSDSDSSSEEEEEGPIINTFLPLTIKSSTSK